MEARVFPDAVHGWFGLSYANYMVLHRTLLQSMPDEWQERFVACMSELDAAFRHVEQPVLYQVTARGCETGRYVRDSVPHYNRGREYIESGGSEGVISPPHTP